MITIAFVCQWDKKKKETWSGTSLSLYEALKNIENVRVLNVNVSPNPFIKGIISLSHKMLYGTFKPFNKNYLKFMQKIMSYKLKKIHYDVVLEIGDIGIIEKKPFYCYQDLCIHNLIDYYKKNKQDFLKYSNFGQYTIQDLLKREKWQLSFYKRCSGVFTMSRWLKVSLENNYLFQGKKIHAVGAGTNVSPIAHIKKVEKKYKCILFIGRDFSRKNGERVVAAYRKLKGNYKYIKLIIAGPQENPLKGNKDKDILFLGNVDYKTLKYYYSISDVFCMPSNFEAYGIVFLEALVNGVPCIGSNKFAMPEIINDYGIVLDDDNVDSIAIAIKKILFDSGYKKRLLCDRKMLIKKYSWQHVAYNMVNQIRKDLDYKPVCTHYFSEGDPND